MTIADTILAPRTATRADAEPLESTPRQPEWRTRYPARAVETDWPATCGDRAEVERIVAAATAELPTQRVREARRWGAAVAAGLACRPARRHLAAAVAGQWRRRRRRGLGAASRAVASPPREVLREPVAVDDQLAAGHGRCGRGAAVAGWLLTGGKKRKLVRNMVYGRDGAGFDRLRRLCEQDPAIRPDAVGDILFRSAVIVAAKGGMLADITVGDVLEILDAECAVRGRADSASATFRMLREAGVLGANTPTLQRDPQSRPAFARPTRRPLPDRVPTDPRPARRLPGRTATGDRLHHAGRPGLSPGAVLLVRPRAASSRHRLAAPAPRGGRRVETPAAHQDHHRHPRRRTGRGRIRTPRLPGHAGHGAGVLPRPGRMGARRPRPAGVCGWHRARSAKRIWSGASSCAAARPAWTAAPANGCRCCPCSSRPSTGGAASRGSCWKPGNRPSRVSSSPPPARPSSGSTGRPRPRTTSGCAIPTPANHDCSTATRNTPSGRGRSSRCSATPASGSRNCSNSATTA